MKEQMRMKNLNEADHSFYRKLLVVGIPMVIQQVIAVTLNLADTIMVGKVGENALAAVGAANQIYFIFGVVLFGVFSGAAVHAVQYWGIRDIASLRKIIGIDYTVCLALAAPATVFVYPWRRRCLIRLFRGGRGGRAAGHEISADRVLFLYVFSGLTFVISYNSRAIQDVTVPTIINGCAILTNVICNYLLIYGKCGFPELGVEGAAIATLLAQCAGMRRDAPFGVPAEGIPAQGEARANCFRVFGRTVRRRDEDSGPGHHHRRACGRYRCPASLRPTARSAPRPSRCRRWR